MKVDALRSRPLVNSPIVADLDHRCPDSRHQAQWTTGPDSGFALRIHNRFIQKMHKVRSPQDELC